MWESLICAKLKLASAMDVVAAPSPSGWARSTPPFISQSVPAPAQAMHLRNSAALASLVIVVVLHDESLRQGRAAERATAGNRVAVGVVATPFSIHYRL